MLMVSSFVGWMQWGACCVFLLCIYVGGQLFWLKILWKQVHMYWLGGLWDEVKVCCFFS